MKTEMKIAVRVYPVEIRDERTGEEMNDTIVLEKARVQAAQVVGVDDKFLILRAYNRKGYRVLSIGQSEKVELTIDLEKACSAQML